MKTIVQSIAKEIEAVEFHSSHPKFFRCGNTFNLEVVSLLEVLYFLRFSLLNNHTITTRIRHANLVISCKLLSLFESFFNLLMNLMNGIMHSHVALQEHM